VEADRSAVQGWRKVPDTASERVAYGLRAARDRRMGDERDFDHRRELAVEGLQSLDELRKLLVEADSFISHMLYRGSWPSERWDVERLIGRLRKEGDPVA
jgi:hypothetical protein